MALSFEPKLHQQTLTGTFAGTWSAIDTKNPLGAKQKEEADRIRADGGVVFLPDPRLEMAGKVQGIGALLGILGINPNKS
jgi:hypothetical protein